MITDKQKQINDINASVTASLRPYFSLLLETVGEDKFLSYGKEALIKAAKEWKKEMDSNTITIPTIPFETFAEERTRTVREEGLL